MKQRIKGILLFLLTLQFIVTAVTGLFLYFRPIGDERGGVYSEALKNVIVGIHNGELYSLVLVENRYWSGLLIGLILAFFMIKRALEHLRRRRTRRRRRAGR